jgi:hypothetical protein
MRIYDAIGLRSRCRRMSYISASAAGFKGFASPSGAIGRSATITLD